MRCQNPHGAVSYIWLAIKQQQHSPHKGRSAGQAAMRRLVATEIACRECIGQRCRLMKAEAQPLAGDGVNASGCITDKRHVTAKDASKTASERNGSPLNVGISRGKTFRKFRELRSN